METMLKFKNAYALLTSDSAFRTVFYNPINMHVLTFQGCPFCDAYIFCCVCVHCLNTHTCVPNLGALMLAAMFLSCGWVLTAYCMLSWSPDPHCTRSFWDLGLVCAGPVSCSTPQVRPPPTPPRELRQREVKPDSGPSGRLRAPASGFWRVF